MRASRFIIPDFFDRGAEMRQAVERHFDDPYAHRSETHAVWNYWYVPGSYTFLRAEPARIFESALLAAFTQRLRDWSLEHLGLDVLSHPRLSLYVNGCGQTFHNDNGNGRWAYVYSLTRWDQRSFTGGETGLFMEESYWDSERCTHTRGAERLFDFI